MKFTLRVYAGQEVEKVYEIEDCYITSGVCQDLFRIVDVDALTGAPNDDGMALIMARNVLHAFMDFYPIAKQLYPDLTEDEYRHTTVKDVGNVLMGVIQYAFQELASVETEKNPNRQ